MAQSIQKDISKLESSIAEYSKSKLYFSSECEELRLKVRDLYEQLLFVDYEYALQNDIEQSLWKNSFYKEIEEHRKKLRHYYHATKNGSQSAIAELSKECQIFRKLLQSYSSFYLSLINKLEEHYKLAPVKLLMKGEELEGIDTTNSHKSILSCFRCLIYLGDLTRYHRDLYNDPHQKDWKNASNYYRKAFFLIPNNGNPHNQLAVLSTYTDDDIETVYRYYRSIVIKFPFLTAAENLVVLFEKNIPKYTAYRRELHSPNKTRNLATRPNAELFKSFVLSFVRLHGMIYSKSDTSSFFEVKLQVIKDLAVLLNRDLLTEEILLKLIIINISSIALDIHRCSSQSPPHSPSKEFKKISYLYSIEFISTIISKAHKSQNNSKYLGSIITCIEWLLTQQDMSNGFQKKEKRIWISFWKNIAQLLTHIHSSRYATPELASIIETREGLPLLPEEIELKGFLPLENSHQHLPLTSSRNNIPSYLTTQEYYRAIRITKLLLLSKTICKKFPILYYSQKDAKYIVSRSDPHPKSPVLSPILQQRPAYILSPNRTPESINNNNNSTPLISSNDSYYNPSPQHDNETNTDVNINNNNNITQYRDNVGENYLEDDVENADELDLDQIEMENNDNERRAQIEEEIASYDVDDFDEDDELLDEIILFKPRNSTEESFQIPNNENSPAPQNQVAGNQFLNFGNNPNGNSNSKNGEFNLFYSGLSIDNHNIFNFIKNPAEEDKSNHNDYPSPFFEATSNQSFFANANSNAESSLWGFSNYSFFSNNSPQSPWLSPTDTLPSQSIAENNKTQVTIIENPFPQIFQANNLKSPYQDWS